MAKREIEEKTARVAAMLEHENLDAVLLNAQHNFAWITAGGSNGIDLSRENGAASIGVTRDGRRFLLANNIEIRRILAEELEENDFDPVEFKWQDEKANGSIAIDNLRTIIGGEAAVATDLLLSSAIPAIESKVSPLRFNLTYDEIERYRALGRDSGAAVKRAVESLAGGESEIDATAILRAELAKDKISSVVTLAAADERVSLFRHPIPTEKRWEKLLMLVTCAKRGGLITSQTRLVSNGPVPFELEQITEATAFVNASILDATRPGKSGAELYDAAAWAYQETGYADEINRHHQGGAAGYKTREWVAHPSSSEIVQVNQAFAWNPSITGTKVEETVLVTSDGFETLTTSPDFPQISTIVNGREYFSPGILVL